jgi:hypothetical protein
MLQNMLVFNYLTNVFLNDENEFIHYTRSFDLEYMKQNNEQSLNF